MVPIETFARLAFYSWHGVDDALFDQFCGRSARVWVGYAARNHELPDGTSQEPNILLGWAVEFGLRQTWEPIETGPTRESANGGQLRRDRDAGHLLQGHGPERGNRCDCAARPADRGEGRAGGSETTGGGGF